MYKYSISFFFFISIFIALSSCDGDCKDEHLEKVEWVTTYIDKGKYNMVEYSITEDKREYIEYLDEIKHTVTIQNNNNVYNGQFAVTINYGYNGGSYDETRTQTFDAVTIAPNESYSFYFYTQAGKYANYSNSYTIQQLPVFIAYKERKDELKTSTIVVNSCKENVEALRQKYKMVKELFNSKK